MSEKPNPDAGRKSPTFPSMFFLVYPSLVEKARELGYAIGVHGSLARDFDLIAAPWTEEAVAPEALIEALREQVDGLVPHYAEDLHDEIRKNPATKPHGRLAWSIHLVGGSYLDVSVLPRRPTMQVVEVPSGAARPNLTSVEEPPPGVALSRIHPE